MVHKELPTNQSFSDELRFWIPASGLPVISYTCARQCRAQQSVRSRSIACRKTWTEISVKRERPREKTSKLQRNFSVSLFFSVWMGLKWYRLWIRCEISSRIMKVKIVKNLLLFVGEFWIYFGAYVVCQWYNRYIKWDGGTSQYKTGTCVDLMLPNRHFRDTGLVNDSLLNTTHCTSEIYSYIKGLS